jgi:protocatechuate 3,4-dioxygenase beta subunit
MRKLLVLLVLVPGIAAAQAQVFQGSGPPPGGAPPQLPPRDARPATATATGTASIRGRIFAADSGKPLRRARVRVDGPGIPTEGATTSTDAEGRYEVNNLAGGRYNITVTRSGYLRLSYGQRRPFELGKPFDLANGRRADNVDFTLPKMSLITGRVLDEANEPISGVRVIAMRPVYFEGRRRLVPVGQPASMTDDAGQYRILGLTPGSYFVMAGINETWTVVENGVERVMGYAQTYYPGVAGVTDARRVMVGVGQEASNTDFALVPGRTATISGSVYDSQGRPVAGRQMQIGEEYRGPGMMFAFTSNGTTTSGDGTFRIANLAPGDYKISLRTTTDLNGIGVQESAAMPVSVSGVDIDNLSLTTSSGWSLNGTIVTDTGEPLPAATATRMHVVARPLSSDNLAMGPGIGVAADNGRVTDNATFNLSGLVGPTTLRLNIPDGWVVQSIQFDGRDVTDAAIEGRSGDVLTGVQIVVTNKVNVVAGSITDAKGAATSDGTVLVFADDAQKWMEDSRFVQSARPDQQGTFQIKGLPAGDYLAVALEYVEDGSWNDPDFLESIRRYAQRVKLAEAAGSQSVALRLISPQ